MKYSTRSGYSAVMQSLHWITAILVLIAFVLGPGGTEDAVYSSGHAFDRELHETLGISIFAITCFRLLWQTFENRPEFRKTPWWMEVSANAMKLGLYFLLLAVPLTAISGAWLEGHSLTFLAGVQIAPPVNTAHGIGKALAEIHSWLGDTILWLAGIHSAAALYHHLILKDAVLRSMLPRWIPFQRD